LYQSDLDFEMATPTEFYRACKTEEFYIVKQRVLKEYFAAEKCKMDNFPFPTVNLPERESV
jgi:hypothetical protein